MCTLIIAWRVFADAPVVVAANRDEADDRPATPPRAWPGEPRIVAPRDERAGGTWIGHGDAGVFVGVSNRWTNAEVGGERSRGHLVEEALRQPSARAAVAAVRAAVGSADYDGFNLLVADDDAAYLVEWEGTFEATALDPGVHVLTNAGFDDRFRRVESRPDAAAAQAESAAMVRETLQPEPDETADDWLDRAATVLGDHEHGVCVHGDGYGTQSASLLALRSDGSATYRYADGPPCTVAFERVEGQS